MKDIDRLLYNTQASAAKVRVSWGFKFQVGVVLWRSFRHHSLHPLQNYIWQPRREDVFSLVQYVSPDQRFTTVSAYPHVTMILRLNDHDAYHVLPWREYCGHIKSDMIVKIAWTANFTYRLLKLRLAKCVHCAGCYSQSLPSYAAVTCL